MNTNLVEGGLCCLLSIPWDYDSHRRTLWKQLNQSSRGLTNPIRGGLSFARLPPDVKLE